MYQHFQRVITVLLLLFAGESAAQEREPTTAGNRQNRIRPTLADLRYGDHQRQVLDLYQPERQSPSPLVVHIHGGGFRAGDKRGVSQRLLRLCNDHGITVASINYRLTGTHPWPAQHHDSRRALQFLRYHSQEYRIDPQRVACTGGSAGAGISLWLAFHEDMVEPESDDPIARESTRINAVACTGAQTSYDPHWIQRHVGGRAHLHPALPALFGLPVEKWETAEALAIFKEIAAINHFTADDPPVWLVYREPDEPLDDDSRIGWGIHHPNFGHELKKLADRHGVECTVKHSTDLGGEVNEWPRDAIDQEIVSFFARHLDAP